MNNSVYLIGRVISADKNVFTIEVPRTSGKTDIFDIIQPARDKTPIKVNTTIAIEGQIACKNNIFVVKANNISEVDQNKEIPPDNNKIYIHGVLRANPSLRITGNGNMVSDLGVDIGIKDHDQCKLIWCIAYRQIALTAMKLATQGSEVEIEGRLGKRSFFSVKENQEKTVTEIAIFKMTILNKKGVSNASKKERRKTSQA